MAEQDGIEANRAMGRISRWAWFAAGWVLACCAGCPLAPPAGHGDALPEGLAALHEEGTLTADLHCTRNEFNVCPPTRPLVGTDEDGVTWTMDRFFCGLLPNPYHFPLDCFRGPSPELAPSSYQCCYDGDELVDEGPLAGSFDFFAPGSPLGTLGHFFFDVLPFYQWQCPPS